MRANALKATCKFDGEVRSFDGYAQRCKTSLNRSKIVSYEPVEDNFEYIEVCHGNWGWGRGRGRGLEVGSGFERQ